MHQWKEVTLDEIADLTVGFVGKTATHYVGEGIRFLRSMNVEPFRINYNDPKFIDQEFHNKIKKSELNSGDVVIVRTGKPGACSVIPQKLGKWNCADLVVVKPNHECVNSTYLAAFINLAYGVINAHLVGAVQQHFNVGVAKKLKIKLPPMDLQNKIGYFIDNINDRIELNEKINKNLEQQAQAIYQQMFITNRNPNWENGLLSDLIAVRYGKDHKKLEDGVYPVYGSGGIMRYVEKPLYTGESVLIPRKGTLNNVMYVNGAFWSVDTMFYTEMLRSNVAKFLYHFVKSKDLASMNAGSAVPSMTTNILNAMQLYIPDNETLSTFEEIVSPMYSQMQENKKQSKKLADLRDTLLPRLMSGELDVSEIEF